ncbi:MAG: DUF2867 domain-containing protein [Hyphomicrobiales bacterium]
MIYATERDIPAQSQLFEPAKQAYIIDCFAIGSAEIELPIEELYARLMSQTPKWFDVLMNLRDRIVGLLGLKSTQNMAGYESVFEQTGKPFGLNNTTRPSKIMDFFTVVALSENEIILSIKDKHLDMQMSLLRCNVDFEKQQCEILMNDVIFTHNFFGKLYLFFIMPVHKIIIKKTLNDAKHRGDI